MDFQKVIYENVRKKKTFILQQTYQVTDILKFNEVLFCTYCKGLLCLYKIVIMFILLCICLKHSQN